MSTTVASQSNVRSPPQRIKVCSSGLLPSDLVRLDGSLIAGISVEAAMDEIIEVAVSGLSAKTQLA